ncbi:MAG TPA: hypothetical protein DDZ88_30825 [Verrucomicrobiales bacterium]|nr:hypothetical protein [Verrucomicrobiales bacterium]
MALRLDTAVIRGEIDNTTHGNVRGKIWLVGREEPVLLDLRGDAWRDVAGSKITFTNPMPEAQAAAATLHPKQKGYVGDISASQKVKVLTEDDALEGLLDEDDETEAASEWRNSLYLEWFSEENGRVFIESTDFEISVAEWLWEMDVATEEAQKLTNLHTMRGWLAGIIRRPEPKNDDDDELFDEGFDDSEESWEASLKQSDRLTDAHMEALEKYGVDGLDDDRVSFVMGWDHMLGGGDGEAEVADDGEAWKGEPADTEFTPEDDDDDDLGEFIDSDSPDCHPLQKRAHDLVIRLMTDIDEEREENAEASDGDTPLDRFIRNTMNISGKLAGALGTRGFGGSRNQGYILAILRRCLNWANEALSALNELVESPAWQDRLDLLAEFRAELFALRDGMTDLRRELRGK